MVGLVAGGSCLFEPSILEAEFRAIWMGIICARQELRMERFLIEKNSAIIIVWIYDEIK